MKITLTATEKEFLWNKIEYTKKKKAIETKNQLFNLLNGSKKTFDVDDFKTILNSLEYSFKKKISGQDKPMKLEVFQNLILKIPSDWIGIKYSSITAREKKIERKPKKYSSKQDIIDYLIKNKIEFDPNSKKDDLFKLI